MRLTKRARLSTSHFNEGGVLLMTQPYSAEHADFIGQVRHHGAFSPTAHKLPANWSQTMAILLTVCKVGCIRIEQRAGA
jgi:hypothetical protein